jgi:hypothetical protein
MANRWKGNLVANAATSDGTAYTGKANGAWGLNSQLQQKQSGLWASSIGNPSAPTIGTATAGNAQASVSFTGNATGGGTVTYTATSTPSGITGSSSSSPVTVTGLTNGTSYTFTVRASNSFGYTSAESSPSNSVTPAFTEVLAVGMGYGLGLFPVTTSGYGTQYAGPSVGLTNGSVSQLIFSTTNDSLILVDGWNNGTQAYKFNAGTGIGTKFSNATSLTGDGLGLAIRPNNSHVVITSASTPYINAYAWSDLTGFGTKSSAPTAALPTGLGRKATFNPAGTVVAMCGDNTPFIGAYPWSTGFGTKYANPASLPPDSCWGLTFSPSGSYLLVQHGASPYISAYNFATGFGSKLANPATLPSGNGYGSPSFNNSGTIVLACGGTYANAYNWSSGFGTKYTDPSTLAGNAKYSDFNPSGTLASFANNSPDGSEPFTTYNWSSGFGTKLSTPTLANNGNGESVAFSY